MIWRRSNHRWSQERDRLAADRQRHWSQMQPHLTDFVGPVVRTLVWLMILVVLAAVVHALGFLG